MTTPPTAGCLQCGDATTTHTTETGCTRRMTANPVGCVLCLREIGWCMCDRKTCTLPHRRQADLDVHGYQLCTPHASTAVMLTPDELRDLVHRTNTPRKAT